ncbi:MAG: polyprenyl synthetase family protein [Alphaproteobacteria bacterium]|nr:polyprenyl synthetase family protein [Alphaproteobacteria bacterium]
MPGAAASLSIATSHLGLADEAGSASVDDLDATLAMIAAFRERIETRLADLLPPEDRAPSQLHAAMRYSVLSPGKRLRPVITALVARQCGGNEAAALDAGCAVEMVHAASLVIDDLPAMDNAELRRGRATTHRVYGDATGILAAISVMNQAYGIVAGLSGIDAEHRTWMATLFTQAIGPEGLAGGQEYDVNGAAGASPADIETVNRRKTGALFSLAAQAGALTGDAANMDDQLKHLDDFGNHLGLAFQTLDDILDVDVTSVAGTGKDKDQDGGKPTLARVEGMEAARAAVRHHIDHALEAFEAGVGPSPDMRHLCGFVFDAALKT